ncbi:unnamed protein product [Acanthoscelides obtectus]|uniref:Uncharacterized protein n=1 Tax=Acanthoscelides obtectus TaxID=200917 RepID=A0A9P0K5C8_ACAOB|nr:unnamed protein product [Acanthoscelides obtectus]CAK1658440.1 hypothetical protein AOBTE_LOCUS20893 [Acanthoscelides obtectus]
MYYYINLKTEFFYHPQKFGNIYFYELQYVTSHIAAFLGVYAMTHIYNVKICLFLFIICELFV